MLHPEFVNGKYAIYTRPQDGFIEVGKGGGIGLGYISDITNPVLEDEKIINQKAYHTIYELKNGQGPAPIKTKEGWLHIAHGVRNTAGGLRYTLYMFMTALDDISKVIYQPYNTSAKCAFPRPRLRICLQRFTSFSELAIEMFSYLCRSSNYHA